VVQEHIEIQNAQESHPQQIVDEIATRMHQQKVLQGCRLPLTRRLVGGGDVGAEAQADRAVHEGHLAVAEV